MKRIASWLTVVLCLCLAACETPTSQRYAVSADNNIAFPRAVQDLIANALRHSQFSALVR